MVQKRNTLAMVNFLAFRFLSLLLDDQRVFARIRIHVSQD